MTRYILFIFILLPTLAQATYNPMFAPNTRNSIGIYGAQSTGPGDLGHLVAPWEWRFLPMTTIMLQYSQPIQILRLPSRVNIHALQNLSYHGQSGTSFAAIGISWDILLMAYHGFYLGVGIGPYMRDSSDDYVASRLVFGERVFIGKNITPKFRTEFFTLHFSNGDFTEPNHGFNFAGIGFNFSF